MDEVIDGRVDMFPSGTRSAEDIRGMAEVWREKNPDAYATVVLMAKLAKASGRRTSIDEIANKIRYDAATQIRFRLEGFRINNTIRAPLVRMIEAEYPDLVGVFEKRRSKVDA